MNTSPVDTLPTPFKSLTALRAAHTAVLKSYQEYEDDKLPPQFIEEVELFIQRATESGKLMDVDEDRSDAQALMNYWTTVLYGAGKTPRPAILANFEAEAASKLIGERCPYRGLQAFSQEDRSFFFGRRQLVHKMTEALRNQSFLAVVGLSGSGKSSLVRAGLLPALMDGAIPGSDKWIYHQIIVPGYDPLRSLSELTCPQGVSTEDWHRQQQPLFLQDETHLLTLLSAGGQTSVIVVDQFEELFTLSDDEAERHAFVMNLIQLVRGSGTRHILILTMRSEFDTYTARYQELQKLFEQSRERVAPLSPIDLRKAIEKPAERAGLSFESGLVEELVQQVLGEPAGLPLLQFTLYKLWERRQGKSITWDIYRELGGNVREVLTRAADATFNSFNIKEDRNISRRIMMRLVRPSGGLDVTSNRVRRESLHAVGARDNVDRVLDIWVAAGLLRVTRAANRENDHFEVMHEALIRNWDMLVAWLDQERVNLRRRLQLTSAAQQWRDHKRDPGALLGGALLIEAEAYDDLNDLEKEFVKASRQAEEAIQKEKEKHEQKLTALRRLQLRLASAFLIIAIGLLFWALWQQRAAVASAREASEERDAAVAAKKIAGEERAKAEAAKNDLEVTRASAEVAARLASAELDRLKEESTEELAKLEHYKVQANTAENRIRKIKIDTANELKSLQLAREGLDQSLKAVTNTLLATRPAILIENGRFRTAPGEWESKLEPHRKEIEKTTNSVGRLEASDVDQTSYVATAFLVASDIALIPGFAMGRGSEPSSKRFLIDFREHPDDNRDHKFAATIIDEIPLDKYDGIILLRVEKRSPSGMQLPPPLVLTKTEGRPEKALYVVGYPARDTRNPAELLQAVFGNMYGVKRLQPGYLLEILPTKIFTHDCLTLAGNAGSPVVDLETGKVIGLHMGGLAFSPQGPGTKEAIALWTLAEHPVFAKAGVTFQ